MSRVSSLYELQQIDSALQSRVVRMRQIDEQMSDSPELLAVRLHARQVADALASEQARLKQASHLVEDTSVRLRMQEKRLYDGSIKNAKELGAVQEEVTHLKQRFKEQEDAAIDLMLSVEAAEDASQKEQAALEAAEKASEQYKLGLMEERDKLMQQAKVLQVKRQRSTTELPFADLQLYERLARAKGGTAVAGVREGVCSGCHTAISTNVIRSARTGNDLVLCPHCGRILYPLGTIEFKAFDHDLDNVDK